MTIRKKKQTKRGILQDKRLSAPVPKKKTTWARSPDRYDWPGIDLPKGSIKHNIQNIINFGQGVTAKKIKKTELGGGHSVYDYEITIPKPPRIGGGTRKVIKPQNTFENYAKATVELIAKKKKRKRWI